MRGKKKRCEGEGRCERKGHTHDRLRVCNARTGRPRYRQMLQRVSRIAFVPGRAGTILQRRAG